MDNSVFIKGNNKSGIIVVLDSELSFDELKQHVARKFSDSAKFLGECKTAVAFKGRELTQEEEFELIDIIRCNSRLDVVCLTDGGAEGQKDHSEEKVETIMQNAGTNAKFYKGNLRSGQTVEMDCSVILIGDVNPGASVTSNGNIIILGTLKGNAIAGAAGNRNAFVMALEMCPMQIRIADIIARSPDNPERDMSRETKIAFLEDGNIYIEPVSKNVLNSLKLTEN